MPKAIDKSEIENRIGTSLKRYFRQALLTRKHQRQMAAELGVSVGTVNNWLQEYLPRESSEGR